MLSLTLHTASVTKGGNYSCCPSRRKQCGSLYHILLQNDQFEITSNLTLNICYTNKFLEVILSRKIFWWPGRPGG